MGLLAHLRIWIGANVLRTTGEGKFLSLSRGFRPLIEYRLLFKIQNVVVTKEKYSALNKVFINGIETFAKQITLTHDVIVRKKYDHIEPR